MIIVSQDRKQVWNYDNLENIFIPKEILNEENWCLKAQTLRGDVYILGYYKTEERAVKVLEEIIKIYLSYASVRNLTGDIKSIHTIPSAYVMPKE